MDKLEKILKTLNLKQCEYAYRRIQAKRRALRQSAKANENAKKLDTVKKYLGCETDGDLARLLCPPNKILKDVKKHISAIRCGKQPLTDEMVEILSSR
jgi:hypothetical protein